MSAACAAAALLFAASGGRAQPPANEDVPAASPTSTLAPEKPRLGPGQSAVSGTVAPAAAGRPAYKLLRYDEDWTALTDPTQWTDFWDPIKFVPLGNRDGYSATFGGDVREWFESYHNDAFGLGPRNTQGFNTSFLQRYMLFGDARLGPNLRLFAQSVSGFEDGRIGGPRPDIDRNTFDAHQAFADWKWDLGAADAITWRFGRQEFEYGTGRLIDVREGPNLRLAFDAARVLAKVGDWSVDGWWAKPVRNNPGTLDDDPSPAVSFWGVYGVRPVGDGSKLNIDGYYLGFENKRAAYDRGSGYELRHSVGTRVWGRPEPFEYNFEAVYQFGTFAGRPISAWTAASAVRYALEDLPLKPRPGVRFDVASGDRGDSQTFQTFNPLFPSGAYFNLTGPFGPQNIIDLHPTLDLTLSDHLTLSADWNFFWRESPADGVYRLSGSLLATGRSSPARFIGSSPAATLVWNPTRHVTLLASYVHVFPGPFLKQTTPGQPVDFVTTWLTYRF